jgi:hypothetical protein
LAILTAVNSFKEEPMRTKTFLSIVGAAAALGTGAVAATGATAQSSSTPAPAVAQAGRFVRHIEGPIIAIDRASRTFTVRDREHRNALAIVKVTPNTRFDNVAGFGALHRGQSVETGDDRGHDGLGHDAGDDRGHDGPGHDAGDDRGHGGHDG